MITPFAALQEMTAYPGTLEVTENRQFRERGLLHITDGAFLFFKHMEEMRVSLLRVSMLSKAVDKSEFVHDAIQTIQRDDTLVERWQALFEGVDHSKEVSLELIIQIIF